MTDKNKTTIKLVPFYPYPSDGLYPEGVVPCDKEKIKDYRNSYVLDCFSSHSFSNADHITENCFYQVVLKNTTAFKGMKFYRPDKSYDCNPDYLKLPRVSSITFECPTAPSDYSDQVVDSLKIKIQVLLAGKMPVIFSHNAPLWFRSSEAEYDYMLEEVQVLLSKNHGYTTEQLVELVRHTVFIPEDCLNCDTYDTQLRDFYADQRYRITSLTESPREALQKKFECYLYRCVFNLIPPSKKLIVEYEMGQPPVIELVDRTYS